MSPHLSPREQHDAHADERARVALAERARREQDARWQRALTVLQMTSSPPATDFEGCVD